MDSTSGGLTCPDCGRPSKSLSRHKGSRACLTAQATNKYRPGGHTAAAIPTFAAPLVTDLSTNLRLLRHSNQLMRRVPKALRYAAADSLIEVLDGIINGGGLGAWEGLMTFSYRAFSLPATKEKRTVSLATLVKNNLARTSDFVTVRDTPKRLPPKPTTSKLEKAVARKMNDGNVSGAVRLLSSEDAVAPPSVEVLNCLKSKHPPANPNAVYPRTPSDAEASPPAITAKEVLEAIASFPNGSAGGLDGLLPQHLKDLIGSRAGDVTDRLLDRLATVLTIMLNGGVPAEVCPLLYGGALTALNKKDGGIRPIACGNTLRRLVGKIVSRRVMVAMGVLVRPQQLGYGTPGGAEAVVHATRDFLAEEEETQVLLKLDFKNAFNTVHREKMLTAVQTHIPEYFALVTQMYRHASELFFGDFVLQSESGVQQGDPLGPLLFCLVTRELSGSIQSRLNAWYLDDGIIGDTVDIVLEDLKTVVAKGRDVGLNLNLAKCEAFVFAGEAADREYARSAINRFDQDICFPTSEELCLLGAPLLSEGIPVAMDVKTVTLRLLTSRLDILPSHQAMFILKNCLSAPKVMYMIRCAPVWSRPEKLAEFDEELRTSLGAITNTSMTPSVWRQASLPVSVGGLGIRKTSELALPAFLASVHSSMDLISTIVHTADLDDILTVPTRDWCALTRAELPATPKSQKTWDAAIVQCGVRSMTAEATARDIPRMKAVACKESNGWLNAYPIPSLGQLLDDNSLRVSVALRLGAVICVSHICRCGIRVNTDGHHGLSCKKSAGRGSRHWGLNDVVARSCVTAGIPVTKEPTGLDRANGKRPDGLTMMAWNNGKSLAWDVTCVDTMANSYIGGSMTAAGHAATEAERKKREKYRHILGRVLFEPLAFETLGPWGPDTKKLIRQLAKRMEEQTGEKRSFEYFSQRFSIEIQKGNAASVLGTHKYERGLDEIFSVLKVKR